MVVRKAPPPAPHDSPDEVEAEFYEALQQGDIDKLMAVWADDDEIACIHPGGPRVLGPQAVRASFEAVFAHGSVDVQPEAVRRYVSHGFAIHHVIERLRGVTRSGPQTAYVVATNVYARTPLGWRMTVHHASPSGEEDSPPDFTDSSMMLH
ncbi:nuclear transport factor 2 family protein [Aquabacterium sp.]|uniref:YybH family protein n=1 Tax=Aquabacterium sp. TaxID=1872578 RepID=UPI0035AE0B36